MDLGCRDSRRRRVRAGASLIGLAALAAAAGAQAGPRPKCPPAGATTLARSHDARVYRGANGAYYACLTRNRRRTFLATSSLPIGSPRTAGPFAAFSRPAHLDGESGDEIGAVVESIGLCRGHRGRAPRRFKYVAPAGEAARNVDPVTDLALSRHGDIAWIAAPAHAGADYRVLKLDATSSVAPAVLASSPDIGPRSLEISGTRIAWRDGDRAGGDRLKPLVSTCRAS